MIKLKNYFLFIIITLLLINNVLWWNFNFSFIPITNNKVFVIKNDKSEFLVTKSSKHYLPKWINYDFVNVDKKDNVMLMYTDDIVLAKFVLKNGQLNNKDFQFLQRQFKGKLSEKYKKSYKIWKDTDNDGIPDTLDFQLGMYKAVNNSASYKDKYIRIKFPFGNVPNSIGVCTDVLVRSYLNAGVSLQKKIYLDMSKRKKAYNGFKGNMPDYSIEHRRVRRLIVYYKKYFKKLPTSFKETLNTKNQFLPGDILFMSLIPGDKNVSHVGVVSGNSFVSTYPLLIHNAAKGFHTTEMDILWFQNIAYRFRSF